MTRRFDYSVPREDIEFGMGGKPYAAKALLSSASLADLLDKHHGLQDVARTVTTQTAQGADGGGGGSESAAMRAMLGALADIFDVVCLPESAAQIRVRLFGADDPLDLQREVLPTVVALVEEYTGRPTRPSSPSTSSSGDDGGTSSTDGAPAAASIPALYPPTGTSTSPTGG